jgi:site-specific recombinase XerD
MGVKMSKPKALTIARPKDESAIIQIVLDAVDSEHTRRAYARALNEFMTWYHATESRELNKATVQRYAAELRAQGVSAASINQRLSAIRKLASEAADNGAMPEPIANGIAHVKGVRQEGTRAGNWLTKEQAQKLLDAPNVKTLKGLRDRALLAVLIGCGLRRQEAADLTFKHIQEREGRWVLVDLVGKRNKVRSVPMPSWTKKAIDEWTRAAEIKSGRVFRSVNKGDKMGGDSMTAQAIRDAVTQYAARVELGEIAPHDLRRTFAKLAHKGGSGLDQIQLSLGHASIKTTEKYLGVQQDLTDAPCDRLGLRLSK